MKLHIEISLDNAALVDDCEHELEQIMKRVIWSMEHSPEPHLASTVLRDSNGNKVGHAWTTED
jgi:hypothetical protein